MSTRKPALVVSTRFLDEIEARIDRDYDARRNRHERPFTRDELIEASAGADAVEVVSGHGEAQEDCHLGLAEDPEEPPGQVGKGSDRVPVI